MRNKLYIQMHSLHGLFRGRNLELGRDEDTGGQIIYVLELAKQLVQQPRIGRVDIITRQIADRRYPGYNQIVERVAPNVRIVRIPCGPKHYLKKIELWPYLGEFVANWLAYFKNKKKPDILHSNFADAGYVCTQLSKQLGIPQIHTGHALGKFEVQRLTPEQRIHVHEVGADKHFKQQFAAEQETINHARAIIVSSRDEQKRQYGLYDSNPRSKKFHIVPPGIDYEHFHSYHRYTPQQLVTKRNKLVGDIDKPLVTVMNRLDVRKNIAAAVHAFAQDKILTQTAHLILALGPLRNLNDSRRKLLTELRETITNAKIKKSVTFVEKLTRDDVADLYRVTAASKGVFVNPASVEPFGLTTLEAAGCGVPVVATTFGGTQDVIATCRNGITVDPCDTGALAQAIRTIATKPRLWQRYSQNGMKRAPRYYAWPRAAKLEVKVFKKILK